MKKTMPFVQFVKARMDELGIAALDLKTDFDEAKVLSDNIDYIVNTLGLEDVLCEWQQRDRGTCNCDFALIVHAAAQRKQTLGAGCRRRASAVQMQKGQCFGKHVSWASVRPSLPA